MKMPKDDGSVRRNALERLRDSFTNQLLDDEALRSSIERDNPVLRQISEGAISGGVAPINALGSAVKGATQGLADAVKGAVVRQNSGFGGIVQAPTRVLSEAATQAANAKPRIDTKALLKQIEAKFGK